MRFFAKLKALTQMIFGNANPWNFILPRTKFDYASQVGDGQGSSTIMAPVLWVARTYPEAPIAVEIDGEIEHDHDMLTVINKPNPYYSGLTLSMATIISFFTAGNAYWIKVRNNQLAVKELWYAPHWLITPKAPADGTQYISHYEYRPNREAINLDVEDVVHFRFGLDPRNMRLGLSPLASVLREVFTDDEAANFTAALLKNSGIPGLIISPAKDVALPGDAEAVKEAYKDKFSGDKRGEPLILTAPTEIKKIAFSPQDLDLGKLRNIPEERVTAVLGIPAAVVGFGTGLQQTKVGATMSELREMAYESCIIPTQRLIASEIQNQLLPDFEPKPNKVRVVYDLSNVRVLQEDQNKLASRLNTMVKGGWITVGEARQLMSLETDSSHDIYLRSFNMIEVPKGGTAPVKIDGNGHDKKAKLFLPGIKATEQQRQLVNRFNKDTLALTKIFAGELKKAFEKLAKDVVKAWGQIAEQYAVDYSKGDKPDLKVTQEDIYADLVGALVDPESYIDYAPHYLRVADQTVGTINNVIGLGVSLSDLAEIRIVAEAGTRKGLFDITNQVKDSLFQAITEAREEGLGPPSTARLIRDLIEKGPWSSTAVRSKIIARTETKYAQNVSSIEAYKASDTVNAVLVFDGQLETSCQICIDRNGDTVTFEEGEILTDSEHPNGTLSLAPVVG